MRIQPQLQSQDQRQLRTAQGYAELGMYLEANSALEEMSRDCRYLHDVLLIKLEIYRSLKNWDLVQATAVSLTRAVPSGEVCQPRIHRAAPVNAPLVADRMFNGLTL